MENKKVKYRNYVKKNYVKTTFFVRYRRTYILNNIYVYLMLAGCKSKVFQIMKKITLFKNMSNINTKLKLLFSLFFYT